MNVNKEIFEAIREAGKAEGIICTGLSIPGDMAMLIVAFSMARAWEAPREAGADPRLR